MTVNNSIAATTISEPAMGAASSGGAGDTKSRLLPLSRNRLKVRGLRP